MEDVLRRIADARVRRKLVILDIYQPFDNPRLGMLADDVATPLQDLFRKKFASEMLLLCPCQPGEVPLVSEEMGQSVFGYYLEEGLRGFADGYNDEEYRDRRVTVRELADFVKARVGRWALRNRGVRQTPVLLGEGRDFALVVKEESDKLEEQPPLADLNYSAFLDKGWKVRDRWLASYPVAPQQVHQLETLLLRLEKRWRSRTPENRLQEQLRDEMRKFEDQVKEAREAADLPAKSHSLFRLPPASDRARAALEKLLEKALGQVKPDSKGDVFTKAKTEFAAEFKKIKPAPSSGDVAWIIWQVAAGHENWCRTQAQVRFLHEVLQAQQADPEFVEMAYLQRLAAAKIDPADWPLATIRQMFKVIDRGETALACSPREFLWVRHLLTRAQLPRRKAENQLLSGDVDSLEKINSLLKDALDQYQVVHDYLEIIRDAQKVQDRAVRLLPSYLPYLQAQVPDSDRGKAWLDAVNKLTELDGLLATSPGDPAPPDSQLEDQLKQVRRVVNSLEELFGKDNLQSPLQPVDPEKLLSLRPEGGKGGVASQVLTAIQEIDAILETPWPSATQRARLWKTRFRLTGALHKQTRDLDKADNWGNIRSRVPRGLPERELPSLKKRSVEETRLAQGLFKLAGQPTKELDRLELGATREKLEKTMMEWWSESLPRQAAKKGLFSQDRLSRVVHPYLLSNLSSYQELLNNSPAVRLRKGERQRYGQWFEKRYQDWAEDLEKAQGYQDLCLKIAHAYRNLAQ
jgi:hypothetical protein